ncbi:MAG: DUF948 domain-containing protein [Melioribacteraceae bacterium]|nr:DUF948 domain-containing protein [Melioribacteraceae bacterium]MCF8264405.1 DUF948 domain-containing protein [Melioribacteraceae bacterium]MCF8412531.1 DUF948 domain-containing protein [Melioribacteraceae bacterium]MCF8432089.1 DUF948 domain-containing protein [Melioribacteraceae bacterium]
MSFTDVLLALLIIGANALVIYLIIFLKKLNKTVGHLQNDVHELITTTLPVIKNLDETSKKLNSVIETVENQVNDISENIDNVKDKFSFLTTKKEKKKNYDGPLSELVNFFSAFFRGFTSYLDKNK